MELATRVYDVITDPENVASNIRDELPEISNEDERRYWKRVIRIAALCHDVGHLPFSHTGEELFPNGWDHERMTAKIIEEKLEGLFEEITPPVRTNDVIKIAVGPKKLAKIYNNCKFSIWETILSEVIVGDAFGVDRMDYLLRDSHHIGVAYGKFDQFRLIDTLRILQDPQSDEPNLGIEVGGLHVAESLLLARYFMYSQVYFHHIRRVYDIHLKKFLQELFTNEPFFSINVDEFLRHNDSMIWVKLLNAAGNPSSPGYEQAKRIIERKHFRLLYEKSPADVKVNPKAVEIIYKKAAEEFGEGNVEIDEYDEKGGISEFPIIDRNRRIISSSLASEVITEVPRVVVGFVFVNSDQADEAKNWLDKNKEEILKNGKEEIAEDG